MGPDPPLILGEEISAFISSLPKGNITWKNLDPGKVVKEVSNLLELGLVENFFERAGIGSAYLDRPCIDPLDPDCPPTAPNYFDRCKALEKFVSWNEKLPAEERVVLQEEEVNNNKNPAKTPGELNLIDTLFSGRKKREANNSTKPAKDTTSDDYYDSESDYSTDSAKSKSIEIIFFQTQF